MKPYQLIFAVLGIFVAVYLLSGKTKSIPAGLLDSPLGGLIGGGVNPNRPERLLAAVPMGQRLPSPGIALAGGGAAYAPNVVSFFEPTVENETPVAAVPLADMGGCGFRAPRSGEVIGNVHVGRGGLPTPVTALSRAQLAERALSRIRAARGGAEPPAPGTGVEPMRAVDVFVTEKAAPVYLILQSGTEDVLWNVQPAPGARIAHVAVIAAGEVGLLLPPEQGQVQVLRTGREPGCAVPPARQPQANWPVFRAADQRIEDYSAAFETYDTWFRDRFGIGAEENVIGFHETAHALVGPVPATYDKVLQTRLAGARFAATDSELVIIGPLADREARIATLVDRLSRDAAGGDVAALRFEPLRRAE